jgi:hypothetical protein
MTHNPHWVRMGQKPSFPKKLGFSVASFPFSVKAYPSLTARVAM